MSRIEGKIGDLKSAYSGLEPDERALRQLGVKNFDYLDGINKANQFNWVFLGSLDWDEVIAYEVVSGFCFEIPENLGRIQYLFALDEYEIIFLFDAASRRFDLFMDDKVMMLGEMDHTLLDVVQINDLDSLYPPDKTGFTPWKRFSHHLYNKESVPFILDDLIYYGAIITDPKEVFSLHKRLLEILGIKFRLRWSIGENREKIINILVESDKIEVVKNLDRECSSKQFHDFLCYLPEQARENMLRIGYYGDLES